MTEQEKSIRYVRMAGNGTVVAVSSDLGASLPIGWRKYKVYASDRADAVRQARLMFAANIRQDLSNDR